MEEEDKEGDKTDEDFLVEMSKQAKVTRIQRWKH